MIPYHYDGNTYNVVQNESSDELVGYRELGDGSVEIVTMFCGMHMKFRANVGTMKAVIAAREFLQERYNQEEQVILNDELETAASEAVQVA
ncbi:hypothetical protein [Paenibacillus alba]|uniref:Uncharacterized protein n=1 Tax=Paenibacillus alba TaxID=1197127 RepID=A0ABU6GER5_9BACL|nr:hypothetical protein [Paenibacillus alba]MEC0231253.1 hypothetical protein [Paenibacillus alba]